MIYVLLLVYVFMDGNIGTQTMTAPTMTLCNETKPLIITDFEKKNPRIKSLKGYCLEIDEH